MKLQDSLTILKMDEDQIAEEVVSRIYAAQPERWASFGAEGRAKSVRDIRYHLSYLYEAVVAQDVALFSEYVEWVVTIFDGLDLPKDALDVTLDVLAEVLQARLSPEDWMTVRPYLEAGRERLTSVVMPTSFIESEAPLSTLAQDYLDALLRGERRQASQLILDTVEQGRSVKEIYLHVFQPVQREIGRLWQLNQISVAQEHYCTAATQLVMSQLYRHIFNVERVGRRLVATCVGGELHEIGVRMVADFFEMEGWDTYYLGANTPARDIIQATQERQADILAISVTLTTHLQGVSKLIGQVRAAVERTSLRILVGGYPFNMSSELWRSVGADGYAPDAQRAIELANRWLQEA